MQRLLALTLVLALAFTMCGVSLAEEDINTESENAAVEEVLQQEDVAETLETEIVLTESEEPSAQDGEALIVEEGDIPEISDAAVPVIAETVPYYYVRTTAEVFCSVVSEGVVVLPKDMLLLVVSGDDDSLAVAYADGGNICEGIVAAEDTERVDDAAAREAIGYENRILYNEALNWPVPRLDDEDTTQEEPAEEEEEEEPEAPEFSFEDELILSVGMTEQLAAESGEELTFSYYSEDTSVATVSESGLVTAVGMGSTWVHAALEGWDAEQMIHVEVRDLVVDHIICPETLKLGVGEKQTLEISYYPRRAEPKSKSFKSSNTSVAKVDSKTGKITAVKAGKANITVTLDNGVSAVCAVTVVKAPSAITLSATSGKMLAGSTFALKAKITSGSASAIRWTSSNTAVLTVQDGVMTAHKAGTAKVTATTFNGKSKSCTVTVLPLPDRMTVKESTTLAVGTSETLSIAYYAGSTKTIGTCTFSSTNEEVATVDGSGRITAVGVGNATIRVNGLDGLLEEKCIVIVRPQPTAVRLNLTSIKLGAGETFQLVPDVEPEDAYTTFKWSTSKKAYAAVNANGLIKGVKKGSATITVKTANGLKATCKVTAYNAPKSVSLNATSGKLYLGETYQLKASFPSGSYSRKITWTSSDENVLAVDENGLVTAVDLGTATVTAKSFNGKKKSCTIGVYPVPNNMTISTGVMIMNKGSTATLKTSFWADEMTSFGSASYKSANTKIVKVSSAGKLSAVATGTTTVTVTSESVEGEPVVRECEVTVYPACTKVAFNHTSGVMAVGQTYHLVTKLTPSNACPVVTYLSSNEKIVKIDETGTLTGVAPGTAKVKVTTQNGKYSICKVTVKKAPTAIKLNLSAGVLMEGKSGTLKATLSSGSYSAITWASSDTSIAKVSSNGKVTARKPGKCEITASTFNGKTAVCKLTVAANTSTDTRSSVPGALLSDYTGSYSSSMSAEDKIEYMIAKGQVKMGSKYSYGAYGPTKFDCSGYVMWCFQQIGKSLPHNAAQQSKLSYTKISNVASLERGDIVCFDNDFDRSADHSGVYLGSGWFMHASSSKGKVVCSYLYSGYYYQHFLVGRRVF